MAASAPLGSKLRQVAATFSRLPLDRATIHLDFQSRDHQSRGMHSNQDHNSHARSHRRIPLRQILPASRTGANDQHPLTHWFDYTSPFRRRRRYERRQEQYRGDDQGERYEPGRESAIGRRNHARQVLVQRPLEGVKVGRHADIVKAFRRVARPGLA